MTLSLLLAGCGAEHRERGASARARASPTASIPAPPKLLPPAKPEQAERVVARALQQVARLRELFPKGAVNAKVIGRAQMVRQVEAQLESDVPKSVVEATSEMLFAFGTVEAGFDVERSLLELMQAELAGFYDPRRKTMYLLADLVGPEREATLSHELVHALQDQHYDLGKLIAHREDASDEQSAIHALAEGDATSAMMDHMLVGRGVRAIDISDELVTLQARGAMEASPNASRVPPIIKRSVISSYTDGLRLVHWARRRGGWAAVDEIWRHLPQTTEQVLHPEKLHAGEPALPVSAPLPPLNGPSKLIYHDVLGEQSLRLFFEEWMPFKLAAEGAENWGGDRVAVFRDDVRSAVAWHVRYDDAASAARGLISIGRGILRQSEDPPEPGQAPPPSVTPEQVRKLMSRNSLCQERAQRGAFAAVLRGVDLAIVAGPFTRPALPRRSAGDCRAALKWAASVAGQP